MNCGGDCARIQAGFDVGERPAKLGIALERVAGDVAKRLRQRFRRDGKRLAAQLRVG